MSLATYLGIAAILVASINIRWVYCHPTHAQNVSEIGGMMVTFLTTVPAGAAIEVSASVTKNLLTASYLFAAVLFVFSLGGLSNQETATPG